MIPPLSLALAGSGSRDDTKATKLAPASARRRSIARARAFPFPFSLSFSSSSARATGVENARVDARLVARSRRACDAFVLDVARRRATGVRLDMSNGRARSSDARDGAMTRTRARAPPPTPPRVRAVAAARTRATTSPRVARVANGSRRRHDGDARGHSSRKLVGAQRRGSVDVHARWTRSRRRVERARARERGRSRRSLSRAVDVVRAHGTKTLVEEGRRRVSRARRLYDKEAALERILARRGAFVDDGQLHAFANGTNDARKARATKHLRERRTSSTFGTRRRRAGAAPPTIRSSPSVPCSVSSPDERMNGSSPLDRVDAS